MIVSVEFLTIIIEAIHFGIMQVRKMKKKIEKVIRKAKNNESLKTASKLIELGWGTDSITWNDARYLYRLIEERRMVIKYEKTDSRRD